jgi:hypothetical protein
MALVIFVQCSVCKATSRPFTFPETPKVEGWVRWDSIPAALPGLPEGSSLDACPEHAPIVAMAFGAGDVIDLAQVKP